MVSLALARYSAACSAVLQGVLLIGPHLVDLGGVVQGHAQLPLQLRLMERVAGGGDQLVARLRRSRPPWARGRARRAAHVGGHRPNLDAEDRLRAAAFIADHVVGHGHGPLEPLGHGLILFFPIAPGEIVRGAEMGVDQHLLGRHPNRRMRIGGKRIGQLKRLAVEGESLLIIGFRDRRPTDRPAGTTPAPSRAAASR